MDAENQEKPNPYTAELAENNAALEEVYKERGQLCYDNGVLDYVIDQKHEEMQKNRAKIHNTELKIEKLRAEKQRLDQAAKGIVNN